MDPKTSAAAELLLFRKDWQRAIDNPRDTGEPVRLLPINVEA